MKFFTALISFIFLTSFASTALATKEITKEQIENIIKESHNAANNRNQPELIKFIDKYFSENVVILNDIETYNGAGNYPTKKRDAYDKTGYKASTAALYKRNIEFLVRDIGLADIEISKDKKNAVAVIDDTSSIIFIDSVTEQSITRTSLNGNVSCKSTFSIVENKDYPQIVSSYCNGKIRQNREVEHIKKPEK